MAVSSRTRRTKAKASSANVLTQGKIVVPMGGYDPEKDAVYGGDQPRAGMHTMRLTQVRYHESSEGKSSIYWRFKIDDKKSPYNGWPYGEMWTNLDPDGALGKTQATMFALLGTTEDFALDLSDTPAGEKARQKFIDSTGLVRGRVYIDSEYNPDEPRAKLARVVPMPDSVVEAAEDDDYDEDEEDDFEEADEYDDEEAEDDGEEEDDEEDEEEYDEDEEDGDDEGEEDEEEEPEPEPAPRARRGTKKAVPAKAAKAAPTRAAKKAPARRARR